MNRINLIIVCVLAVLVAAVPRFAHAQPPAPAPIRAVVTIPPLKALVEPLLPPGSELIVLVPPGVSEHGYEIPPDKLAALAKADLIVCVGLGMEPQVDRFLKGHKRAEQRVVVFADAAHIECDGDHDHDHADAADHNHHHHGDTDPHLWLSPTLTVNLAEAVGLSVQSIIESRGLEHAAAEAWLAPRTLELVNRIRAIDERYRRVLATAQRRTIVTGHEAFGRLGDDYQLKVIGISGLSAGEPTLDALRTAAATVRAERLTTIFVEPQLSPEAAHRIAASTSATIATLDPLGDGDWFALMDTNLRALAAALGANIDAPPVAPSPALPTPSTATPTAAAPKQGQ